jgi:enamine deaminase RidA (YjgF/YER057c/UK114 family)
MNSPHARIQPAGWPRPRGYSNGVLAAPGSRVLTVAGQVAWNAEERIVSERFHEQFAQALRNVCAVLESAGGRPEHVIRLTFYVTDKDEYASEAAEVGRHYRALMGDHYPACTLVEVSALLEEGAKVEIEATAAVP